MEPAILDTDILSEILKGHDQHVVERAADYARTHGRYTVTSVTVYEIAYGLHLKGAANQLQKALAWLGRNQQVTPTEDDYLAAAFTRASARRQGSILELPDFLIAAVAIRLQMPLVTGNTSDFEAIRRTGLKLTIQNWREP
ncbi:MAG TPA: PIN domain-containing protein [Fimbriimonadaceae bacterium]|nr:PIN domain-containing protein [Fimbriimonadaceae bacterium]